MTFTRIISKKSQLKRKRRKDLKRRKKEGKSLHKATIDMFLIGVKRLYKLNQVFNPLLIIRLINLQKSSEQDQQINLL